MSRELILKLSISVDGFVSGPNGEKDWVFRTASPASTQWLVDQLGQMGLIAVGRQTFEQWVDFWPTSTSPFAHPMNGIPKAVFSRSGKLSPPNMEKVSAAIASGQATVDETVLESWRNPIVLGADLVADVQRLKAEDGKPILALGGASFATSLIAANLVDVFQLVVHPVALGKGLPVFADLQTPLYLKLEDLKQFDSGGVVKIYRPVVET